MQPLVPTLGMLGALLAAPVGAEPFVPTDDAAILERLPRYPAASAAALRRSRAGANATDLATALDMARAYFAEGQRSQDPRPIGYAQAALAPWWDDPEVPVEVLVLRAAIHQNRHRFAEAVSDLDAVLTRDQGNPQAWATRAAIELVQGEPARALASCRGLHLAATICRAAAMARLGQARVALALLDLTLARAEALAPPLELWARTELAEIARILGEEAKADRELRRAVAIEPRDAYALCALADLLLDLDRPAEALALVENEPAHDGKLLRATIAGRRLDAPWWPGRAALLDERFAAATRRGDALHLREEARYRLALRDEPAAALDLALLNWRDQKEVWDARILLESAIAARRPDAAEDVLAWLRRTGLDDTRLASLLARLEAEG